MRSRTCIVLGAAAAALVASAPVAQAGSVAGSHDREDRTVVYTLRPSTHGNPEGVVWDRATQTFFVGATGDGTIYRGRLGDRAVHPWVLGAPGRVAVGLEVFHGRLYVAGGPTGKVWVYDIADKKLVATFDTGTGGFLNDLAVTSEGDVYVTDSFRPTLWHITAAQVHAGHGTVHGVDVAPEIAYQAGQFNLNGIVAFGERELVVVDSITGQLFRIRFHEHARRTITLVHAPKLVGGDGMIVDRGLLVVVVGSPATLNFVRLDSDHDSGRLVDRDSDPSLHGPSTVARADDRYLVVNADFATSTTPFTVSGLPRDEDDD